MKRDYIEQNENLQIGTYKKIMSGIEFMHSYMEEPDLFTPDSSNLKNFLIHSFCYLHPDFEYLSFVSKEDIDLEIIKISHILQILPTNIKKNGKLFDNMSKDDINKFWLKFFTLFKIENNFSINPVSNISCEHKINFLKDIKSTLNYINYEIPTFQGNKLSNVNVTTEIDSWKQLFNNSINVHEEISLFNINEEQTTDVDMAKLIKDLKHIVLTIGNINAFTNKSRNSEYVEFFNNFINLTDNVLQYKNNLHVIYSAILEEINLKKLSDDNDLSGNLFYIKRCNNFIRALKAKIECLI